MKTEKSAADCLKESMVILGKIKDLGIPMDSPEVSELRKILNDYVKDGTCYTGTLNFLRFGRMVEVNLPRRADKLIEVTLRLPRA